MPTNTPRPIIRPTPGFDYLLTDGRKVRVIGYQFGCDGRGWECWPHDGPYAWNRVMVKDIKEFAQELTEAPTHG